MNSDRLSTNKISGKSEDGAEVRVTYLNVIDFANGKRYEKWMFVRLAAFEASDQLAGNSGGFGRGTMSKGLAWPCPKSNFLSPQSGPLIIAQQFTAGKKRWKVFSP